MKHTIKIWRSVVVVIGFMMAGALVEANDINSSIVKPGDQFFDKSYNDLASEWTNWLVKEPIATNPAFDTDGQFCNRNQQGSIWFLATTFGGVENRTCEIPAGKAIFISLGGVFVSFSPDFPENGDPCLELGTVVGKVRCDVNEDIPVAPNISLEVNINGEPVADLLAFRAQSGPEGFTLSVPDPSLLTDFTYPAGDRFPAVADGYFLFLKPLESGGHTLNILTTITDPSSGEVSESGANYTLIVSPDDDDDDDDDDDEDEDD